MSCHNLERKIYELRKCGCKSCEREYYNLRRNMYDPYYDAPSPYIDPPSRRNSRSITAGLIAVEVGVMGKEPKVEEPKNIAHKLLLDQFKAEQKKLQEAEGNITSYKKIVAIHTKAKSEAQKNLKELGAALKKLGHKEETNNA